MACPPRCILRNAAAPERRSRRGDSIEVSRPPFSALQISAPVQPGNSGGPLLDSSGNVMGVVAAKINTLAFAKAAGDMPENINFAIKIGAVRDFLDNSAVSYQTAEPGAELKAAQIASSARAYTMLISCTANEEDKGKK